MTSSLTGTLAGHTVSRVGFGAMQLERLEDNRPAAIAVIRRAIELGINHIDTAEFYGDSVSNSLLREALRPEDDVVIVSKVGADRNPEGPVPLRAAQKPAELRASVHDNVRTLGLGQIPVVNLRRMETALGLQPSGDQVVDLDDQLAEMISMRDEGLIGAIGLSSVGIDSLRRALPAGIVCVQNAYSLVARDDEDLLELCLAEGIAWVPYFPLGSAFPGLPKVTDEAAVQDVARQLGATPAQVGLAWLLNHAPNVLLIPGTADIAHLEANFAVEGIQLTADQVAALEAIPTR